VHELGRPWIWLLDNYQIMDRAGFGGSTESNGRGPSTMSDAAKPRRPIEMVEGKATHIITTSTYI